MTNPKLELLTPQNCQLIFIDHQPQMAFGVQSIDRQVLKNNTVALAKAAKVFKIPITITTVETESFSGHTYPELLAVFPGAPLLERTSMNSWDDQKVRDALASATAARKSSSPACGPRSATTPSRSVRMRRRGLRDLHGGGRLRRHVERGARLRHAAHDPGRRRAGDLAAGDAGMAARLGPQGDLRRGHGDREGAFRRLRHGRRLRLHHGPQGGRAGASTARSWSRSRPARAAAA